MIWYCSITVLGTVLGQLLCTLYVRRRKRYSTITLAITSILLCSLIALVAIGFMQMVKDIKEGNNLGFNWERLCSTGTEAVKIIVPTGTEYRGQETQEAVSEVAAEIPP